MKLNEIPRSESVLDKMRTLWNNCVRNDGKLRCDLCGAVLEDEIFFLYKELLCESCYELHNNHSPPDRR